MQVPELVCKFQSNFYHEQNYVRAIFRFRSQIKESR